MQKKEVQVKEGHMSDRSCHVAAYPTPSPSRSADSAGEALSFSKARKKILLAWSTVTSTWRSADLRIKLRSVSLSHSSKNVRALL